MNRTPLKRKTRSMKSERRPARAHADAFEAAFREDVQRRSMGICELCRTRPATEVHHRRSRRVEWSRWLPDNGLDLCDGCHHAVIHSHPDWAYRHALLLHTWTTDHPRPVLGCSLRCEIDHH